MASLMPNGKQQYFNPSTGAPLAGGLLYTYVGGTSTPKATYADAGATITNANPVVLDAAGSAVVFWSGNYKVVLCDPLGNVIYTVDNYSTNSREHPVQVEMQTATAGQTVFTLAQTTYTPGINSLHVYVDGLRMFMPDYAETSGTVVTFASPLAAGQAVMFECGSAANSQSALDASIVPYTPGGGGAQTNVAAALNGKPDSSALAASGGSALVGFQQAGTGAVASTMQSELRNAVINVKQFGAKGDGATDDAAAIQAALNFAATFSSAIVEFSPGAKYKCLSGLSMDISRVSLHGQGAWLDFPTLTAGTALSFTQSNTDPNVRTALNHARTVEQIVLAGPGAGNANAVAVSIDDPASPNTLAGGTLRNVAFINWGVDIALKSGAFSWTFDKCASTVTSGTPTTASVVLTTNTNNGERNAFFNCKWFNRAKIFDGSNGNSTTFFGQCSFDYFGANAFVLSAGQVEIAGTHIEANDDTGNWFVMTGQSTGLTLSRCALVVPINKTAYSPFRVGDECVNGLALRDLFFGAGSGCSVPLVADGTGRVLSSNITSLPGGKPRYLAKTANMLAYGGFESASFTDEFTVTNGAARSTVQAHSGTNSLSLPASAGVTPDVKCSVPVQPGQFVYGELWYIAPALTGSGGTLYCEVSWRDKAGAVIGSASQQLATTTNVAAWTRLSLHSASAAPAGAVSYMVYASLFGTTTGTPTGYLDDVVLNVC